MVEAKKVENNVAIEACFPKHILFMKVRERGGGCLFEGVPIRYNGLRGGRLFEEIRYPDTQGKWNENWDKSHADCSGK